MYISVGGKLRSSLLFKAGHTLTAFEKMTSRKIFGLKADDTVRGERGMHNYELHHLNSSPHTIENFKSRG
jgi:hypothetical protein